MASQRFPIPAAAPDAPHCTELEIRKSLFLAQACRCASRAEARNFVESIRALRPDATHNCWAYVAGAPGDSGQIGSSDDGEPHGTAGRPMLNVLLHCGIGQICVVVSRWFGGVKLGTGGLVRAYQDSCLKNLETLPLGEAVPRAVWSLDVDYSYLAAIQRGLPLLEAKILLENYAEKASLVISAPVENNKALAALIANASNGSAILVEAPEIGGDA